AYTGVPGTIGWRGADGIRHQIDHRRAQAQLSNAGRNTRDCSHRADAGPWRMIRSVIGPARQILDPSVFRSKPFTRPAGRLFMRVGHTFICDLHPLQICPEPLSIKYAVQLSPAKFFICRFIHQHRPCLSVLHIKFGPLCTDFTFVILICQCVAFLFSPLPECHDMLRVNSSLYTFLGAPPVIRRSADFLPDEAWRCYFSFLRFGPRSRNAGSLSRPDPLTATRLRSSGDNPSRQPPALALAPVSASRHAFEAKNTVGL